MVDVSFLIRLSAVCMLISGCALYEAIPLPAQEQESRPCAPRSDPLSTLLPEGLDQAVPGVPEGIGLEEFTLDVRRVAAATGLVPLLTRLVQLEHELADSRERSQLDKLMAHRRLMTVHHRLVSRVMLASLQVERVASTIRCEYARTRDMWDSAQIAQDRRSNLQTAAAVILAGAGATMAGVFAFSDMVTGIGLSQIIGGTLGAILGTTALIEQVGHEVSDPPDILLEVWEGSSEPLHIPPAVWRLLTEPRGEDLSLRDLILADWRRGMEQLDGTGLEDLLFQMGVKGLEALRVRTTMLEILSTTWISSSRILSCCCGRSF